MRRSSPSCYAPVAGFSLVFVGMGPSWGINRPRRAAWQLPDRPGVLCWQLGMAWSSLAALADACTGRRMVLSGLVLLGPVCVSFTGRWLRTAVAGGWATALVVFLGIPDGIAGTRLEVFLVAVTATVAVASTLALVITLRACLTLAVTALLAGCGGHGASPGAARAVSAVSCGREYENWKRGPVSVPVNDLAAALKAIDTDRGSRKATGLRPAMERLESISLRLGLHPMPHCADRADLWDQYVAKIYAVGAGARSAKDRAALVREAAALSGVSRLGREITAEAGSVLARNQPGR